MSMTPAILYSSKYDNLFKHLINKITDFHWVTFNCTPCYALHPVYGHEYTTSGRRGYTIIYIGTQNYTILNTLQVVFIGLLCVCPRRRSSCPPVHAEITDAHLPFSRIGRAKKILSSDGCVAYTIIYICTYL